MSSPPGAAPTPSVAGDDDLSSLTAVFSRSQPVLAGVERDVKVLITRVVTLFDEMDGLRFQYFLDIWKDMKFSLIFCGRQYERELYEMTEDLLDLVKRRTLKSEMMGVRAAALYLLYALYWRQPLLPKIKIRLTMEELEDISALIDECREGHHWDLVYVWTKLIQDHAFVFVAQSSVLGPEVALYGLGGKGSRADEPYAERENPLMTEDFQAALGKLSNIHNKYQSMKVALSGPVEDPSLNYTSKRFVENIQTIAVNIYDPHKYARLPDNIEVDGNLLGTSDGKTIGQRRKQIREQAFSNEKLTKRQRDIKKFNRRSSSSDVSAEEGSKSVSDDSPTRSQTVADSAGDDDYSPKSRVRKCKKKKRGSRKIGKYLSSTYGSTALDDGITFDLEEYEKSLFTATKARKNTASEAETAVKKKRGRPPKIRKLTESSTGSDEPTSPKGKRKPKASSSMGAELDATIESVISGSDDALAGSVIEAVVSADGTLVPCGRVCDAAPSSVERSGRGGIRVADFAVVENIPGPTMPAAAASPKGKGKGKRSKKRIV